MSVPEGGTSMRRLALALFGPLFVSGCVVLEGSRVGQPPNDADAQKVERRLAGRVHTSIERHTQVAGWVRVLNGYGQTGGSHGLQWVHHFAVRRPGDPEDKVQRLPVEMYVPLLTAIRADVLPVVEGAGVEITSASPVELREGDRPRARFEIRYLRNNRTVAGEVVGVVELADASAGWDAVYTDAKVTHREWVCK
jgi:hypothetical protein